MLYSGLQNTPHSIEDLELPRHTLLTELNESLNALSVAAAHASSMGLKVAAGHGLNYQNVKDVAEIGSIEELNIGQSIIARSIFTGLERAVVQMKELLR